MPNILKTLKGPLSTPNKKNRNGRIYSKQLWENVLNSEYWKDMMDNNTLCGEVVHPGERTESDSFEIDARNVSHRISEAHLEGDKLMGTIEILDTEQGRNLLSLVDAGCIMGISARGMGDIINGNEVDPDTYNFKTFDITFRPSDPNARLIPLEESEKKVKLVFNESEQTDRLIQEGMYDNPSELMSDKDRVQLCKEIIDYCNSHKTIEELQFSLRIHIKVTLDGQNFGNVFISQLPVDSPYDVGKYKVFSNKIKSISTTVSMHSNIEEVAQDILTKFEELTKETGSQSQLDI